MRNTIFLSLLFTVIMLSACGRPALDTTGLGAACQGADGCKTGQSCEKYTGPGGSENVCVIKCKTHGECPQGFSCMLPPIPPDAMPYVCEKD